jgi:hypothetical protein
LQKRKDQRKCYVCEAPDAVPGVRAYRACECGRRFLPYKSEITCRSCSQARGADLVVVPAPVATAERLVPMQCARCKKPYDGATGYGMFCELQCALSFGEAHGHADLWPCGFGPQTTPRGLK